MKNVTKEVQSRMAQLTEDKEIGIKKCHDGKAELIAKRDTLDAEKEALNEHPLDNFEAILEIDEERGKINAKIKKYDELERTLRARAVITEAESDKVIDSLLDYERQLESAFMDSIREHVTALQKIRDNYVAAVDETENTISQWTRTIHPNYRAEGTVYHDTGTNRSPRPVPVHITRYTGGKESGLLKEYLERTTIGKES